MRHGRGSALVAAVLLAVLTGCEGNVAGESPVDLSHEDTVPVQSPTPSPTVAAESTSGWPTTSKNRAGVYAWGSGCGGISCSYLQDEDSVDGFMHNGYDPGSGDVSIVFHGVPGLIRPHIGGTPVTVFGYEGTYRRDTGNGFGGEGKRPCEEWMVDIQGTTATIQLCARAGVPASDVAEAHEIIESIRVEPGTSDLGFALNFTLTTGTWDSG